MPVFPGAFVTESALNRTQDLILEDAFQDGGEAYIFWGMFLTVVEMFYTIFWGMFLTMVEELYTIFLTYLIATSRRVHWKSNPIGVGKKQKYACLCCFLGLEATKISMIMVLLISVSNENKHA